MQLNVYDKNEKLLGIIDEFTSLIWTKRHYECGDFELYMQCNDELLSLIRSGYYVNRTDDDMTCIIESIKIDTDVEYGDYITVTGRDLKSILDRRIVWYQTSLYGKTEECIRRLIQSNAITPDIASRRIRNLKLGELHGFTETMEEQITGTNLYESVVNICKANKLGFNIYLKNHEFVFDLYKGTDRSYDQKIIPYVVFSPEFDNLPRSNYQYNTANYKNTALVAGEGEGTARRHAAVEFGADLDRREMYIDARDISSNEGEIDEFDYNQLLLGRGNNKLAEAIIAENIDGEIETLGQYTYGVDYFLGDIVQVKNEYGVEAKATVIEAIECEDTSGKRIVPTFSAWEFN